MDKKMVKKKVRSVVKVYKSRIKYEEILYSLIKQKFNHSGSDMNAGMQSGDICKRKQG